MTRDFPRPDLMLRSLTSTALLSALLVTSAGDVGAQASHRLPRRFLIAGVGAAVGFGLASIANKGNGAYGACSSASCITIASTGAGGVLGFLIGSEQDHLHDLRYRGGRPLSIAFESTDVDGEPLAIAAGDSLAVAAGTAGAEEYRVGPRALRRAGVRGATLRGITAVAVAPTSGAIALGTAGGAYFYPAGGAPGALVLESPVSAAAAGTARTFLASGSNVLSLPAGADSAGAWPSAAAGAPVRGLVVDAARGLVWAGTDSGIVAFAVRGDSLARVGTLATNAPVRRLSADGARLAVALGDSGVRVFEVSNAAAPRESGRWRGERFAFDVALGGSRLYVASGLDGVTVLDVGTGTPRVIGLARNAGFAVALASRGRYTYVLDRTHNALRRFDSTSPTQ